MGTCGCGDLVPHTVLKIDDDRYIVFEIYPGCDYCEPIIGASLHFFDNKGLDDWLEGEDIAEVSFDEYGGSVHSFPFFSIDDLSESVSGRDEGVIDYIKDEGLDLIQSAIRKRQKAYWDLKRKTNNT